MKKYLYALAILLALALGVYAQGGQEFSWIKVGATSPTRVNLVRVNRGVSWNPASVATVVCVENATTITATGAAVGDIVIVTPEAAPSVGIGFGYSRVSAADVVTQQLCNPTAGALDAAALNVTVTIIKASAVQ